MPSPCAAGCTYEKERSMFQFPKNPEKYKQWVEISGIKAVSKNPRLCEKHFKEDCFYRSPIMAKSLGCEQPRRCRLLDDAVPTIFDATIMKAQVVGTFTPLKADGHSNVVGYERRKVQLDNLDVREQSRGNMYMDNFNMGRPLPNFKTLGTREVWNDGWGKDEPHVKQENKFEAIDSCQNSDTLQQHKHGQAGNQHMAGKSLHPWQTALSQGNTIQIPVTSPSAVHDEHQQVEDRPFQNTDMSVNSNWDETHPGETLKDLNEFINNQDTINLRDEVDVQYGKSIEDSFMVQLYQTEADQSNGNAPEAEMLNIPADANEVDQQDVIEEENVVAVKDNQTQKIMHQHNVPVAEIMKYPADKNQALVAIPDKSSPEKSTGEVVAKTISSPEQGLPAKVIGNLPNFRRLGLPYSMDEWSGVERKENVSKGRKRPKKQQKGKRKRRKKGAGGSLFTSF